MNASNTEEWAPIPGYEDFYSISTLGRVRSESRTILRTDGSALPVQERILAVQLNRGYQICALKKPRERYRHFSVHKLVLLAFVGPRPVGKVCCHGNGVRDDNRLANLRYDTQANNIADKKIHGTHTRGEAHPRAVLTESDVRAIRSLNAAGSLNQSQIGALFRVRREQVNAIVNRRIWEWVQ